MNKVAFATSNTGKVREARVILAPFGVEVMPLDAKGVEVQAETVAEVAAQAAKAAAERLGRGVMVEDAGLFVVSLGGFPGPYSAYVFKTIGLDGLLTLLKADSDRRATFMSAVAYCEPAKEARVFEGTAKGRLTAARRGTGGFGFDPLFVPDGSDTTLAEVSLEEKCRVSHRGESMRRFGSWFASR